jgi:hypothetical protein
MNPNKVGAAALVILVLSGVPVSAKVLESDGSQGSVQALLRAASDGDTITLPSGTFSWTAPLKITKGITLQGNTTITGAGTANAAATDATIIQDDTPRNGGILDVGLNPNQSFRLTGVTFAPGASTVFGSKDGAFNLHSNGSSPNNSVRIDHCHFSQLYQGKIIHPTGWIFGVADHNLIEVRRNSFPFYVRHGSYGGTRQKLGNGAWADYPWFGTNKFWFIETNTIIRFNVAANSLVDCDHGGRWVARHNYLRNCIPNGHGTEGGAPRGQRANEFYDNTVDMSVAWNGGGQRSGTSLWHDNTFTGVVSATQKVCSLANYRETSARAYPVWGIADGTSVWDQNDTDGNGHYVEGQPPHLFDSGTVTTASVISRTTGTITDSTKQWTVNQWAGATWSGPTGIYSIKSTTPGATAYTLGSFILSNTATTITYYYYDARDTPNHLTFNVGDGYEIHRVLTMMDQNGRGKGDQVTNHPKPINATTGRAFWTHQALEPCYSWNNIHSASKGDYGFRASPAQPTTKLGLDYFNLGAHFAWDTTPSEVSARYRAALNGVDYVGTFVYPHPLVSGGGSPTPTPSATPSVPPSLPKAKKAERKFK